MSAILEVSGLVKQFGSFHAVHDVSFSVREGEIVGLLGPNGAGKTTTIQMLLGLMTPDQGEIVYFGKSLRTHRTEILKKANHMSGYSYFPWRLSVYENLTIYGLLYEIPDRKNKIYELSEQFGIAELLPKKFQDLSAGQRTRSFLVKAFLNDPQILLLDEPTASLDPDIANSIRTFIHRERKKRHLSMLITSHNMQEVEELCDQVVFLHRGRVLAKDTPVGLARKNTQSQLQLMVPDGLKRLTKELKKRSYIFSQKNRFVTIELPESDIANFLLEISSQGIYYSEIELKKPTLEDFFLMVSAQRKK